MWGVQPRRLHMRPDLNLHMRPNLNLVSVTDTLY
jgi:hypothetical protein